MGKSKLPKLGPAVLHPVVLEWPSAGVGTRAPPACVVGSWESIYRFFFFFFLKGLSHGNNPFPYDLLGPVKGSTDKEYFQIIIHPIALHTVQHIYLVRKNQLLTHIFPVVSLRHKAGVALFTFDSSFKIQHISQTMSCNHVGSVERFPDSLNLHPLSKLQTFDKDKIRMLFLSRQTYARFVYSGSQWF